MYNKTLKCRQDARDTIDVIVLDNIDGGQMNCQLDAPKIKKMNQYMREVILIEEQLLRQLELTKTSIVF